MENSEPCVFGAVSLRSLLGNMLNCFRK